jgi:hypothetical protein
MKRTIDILRGARTLLEDPARWLHGNANAFTVDASGVDVGPRDPRAARWELNGALDRHCDTTAEYLTACEAVRRALPRSDVVQAYYAVASWHDDPARAHADVLAALDKAIAALTWETAGEMSVGLWPDGPTVGDTHRFRRVAAEAISKRDAKYAARLRSILAGDDVRAGVAALLADVEGGGK